MLLQVTLEIIYLQAKFRGFGAAQSSPALTDCLCYLQVES